MNSKKGNSTLTIPIIFLISIFLILIIGSYIINLILPFIYYQKLDAIAIKYMFVIEKFGYLTELEKNNFLLELENVGFNKNNIQLVYPTSRKSYGELVEFSITYKLNIKMPIFSTGIISYKNKETKISIRKNSFSKISL